MNIRLATIASFFLAVGSAHAGLSSQPFVQVGSSVGNGPSHFMQVVGQFIDGQPGVLSPLNHPVAHGDLPNLPPRSPLLDLVAHGDLPDLPPLSPDDSQPDPPTPPDGGAAQGGGFPGTIDLFAPIIVPREPVSPGDFPGFSMPGSDADIFGDGALSVLPFNVALGNSNPSVPAPAAPLLLGIAGAAATRRRRRA